jgi:transposase-like protein
VQLVISDAHEGLRSALSQVFAGAAWQRCKVHFLLDVSLRASAVPKLHAPAVLAVVKSILPATDSRNLP